MKKKAKLKRDYIINCDGSSPLYDLAQTSRTEKPEWHRPKVR